MHSAHVSDREPEPQPERRASARCKRRPALHEPGKRDAAPRGGSDPHRPCSGCPVLPAPSSRPDAPRQPDEGEGECRAPPSLLHPSPPSAPSASPASASNRSVLPEALGSRCRRLPRAAPLPPGLRLPLTPAGTQEEANSPRGLLPRFPAATNGSPPPGSRARPLAVEDREGAPAGRPKGEAGEPREGLRGRRPPPRSAPCWAIRTCHVRAPAAAAWELGSTPRDGERCHPCLLPFTHVCRIPT